MIYEIISTGSNGNAVVINKRILIDCGVPFKKLTDVYKELSIVLLTHIHSDHFNRRTIKKLAADRPTLRFACGGWLVPDVVKCGVEKRNIDVVESGKMYDYKSFKICPITLYHDVENIWYRVFMNGEKLIYATDTYTLDGITAKNYDLYMIEANYTDEELKQRLTEKHRNGDYAYEERVPHTHLSKSQADNFIIENGGTLANFVYLHMHGGGNNDGNG